MPLYFAYGSNLLTTRLGARCASARAIGAAVLPGHTIGFAKYSWMDGSGKATLLVAAAAATTGILYEMSEGDRDRLDTIEGVGKGYHRIDNVSLQAAGTDTKAFTYVADDPRHGQKPFDWYLALVLAGADQHGIHTELPPPVRSHPWETDPEAGRPGRLAAVTALEAAGYADWPRLLPAPPG